MQSFLSSFFKPDDTPENEAIRRRIHEAAEQVRMLERQEMEAEEARELATIASEQSELAGARQRRAEARAAQQASDRQKRAMDLARRRGGHAEIVEGLWLGNESAAADDGFMVDAGIVAVVNATRDIPCYFEGEHSGGADGIEMPKPEYLRLPVSDSVNESIAPHLGVAVDFISANIGNGSVLVHCREGKSRSVAVVVAYLMKVKGMKMDASLELVKSMAWTPSVNDRFTRELMDLEVKLFPDLAGKSSAQAEKSERESRPAIEELHPGLSAEAAAKLMTAAADESKQRRPRRPKKRKEPPAAEGGVTSGESAPSEKRTCSPQVETAVAEVETVGMTELADTLDKLAVMTPTATTPQPPSDPKMLQGKSGERDVAVDTLKPAVIDVEEEPNMKQLRAAAVQKKAPEKKGKGKATAAPAHPTALDMWLHR